MSKELKHKIYLPTNCLSEKMLFDYIDNKLNPKERHVVEKHLLDCELCSDALEGLEITKDRNRIQLINETINKRILASAEKEVKVISFNYKFALSIAATIALLVIGVFFFNKISLKEADLAELKQNEAPPATTPSLEESTGKLDEQLKSPSSAGQGAADESPALRNETRGPVTTVDSKTSPYKSGDADLEDNKNQVIAESMNEAPMDAITMDDRELSPPAPEESVNLPKGGVAERENNSKLDASKSTADEKAVSGNSVYWASPKTPDQNQAPGNNLEKQAPELSKKSNTDSRDNQYRSESKKKGKGKEQSPAKDQSAVSKESRADEDLSISESDKNVAYQPNSISQTDDQIKEELKSEIGYATTINTNTTNGAVADSTEHVFSIVEVMPEYPGGNDSLMKFIRKNFNYPIQSTDIVAAGSKKVYVQFIVGKNGILRDVKVIKGVAPAIDKEAIRVVKMMPKWKPGKQNGKAVSVLYNLPIKIETK